MVETSVIIPVLNGEAYICAALESVLKQLNMGDEVLVIDDGSSDSTRSLVKTFGERVFLFSGLGVGPSAARNLGLANSSGSFVAFLDCDDLWPDERHLRLKSALLSDPNADVAVGKLNILIENEVQIKNQATYLAWNGLHSPTMIGSCLYRRNSILKVGGFNERMRRGEDSEFYVRLLREGAVFADVDCDSLIYRRHSTNSTNISTDFGVLALELLRTRRGR